jgi:hypothetical protein
MQETAEGPAMHRMFHCAGRTAFVARHAAGPVTKQGEKAVLEADGRDVVIVDTPGARRCTYAAPSLCMPAGMSVDVLPAQLWWLAYNALKM